MFEVTDSAVKKVKQLLEAEGKEDHGLRVAVMGGGCAGFQYSLTYDKDQKDDDQVLEFGGLRVFLDMASRLYLEGVQLDYLDGLQESGFKFKNPAATGTCGCGSSFSA